MNMLTKIAQNKNIFVCDFVDFVKLTQYELQGSITILMRSFKIQLLNIIIISNLTNHALITKNQGFSKKII